MLNFVLMRSAFCRGVTCMKHKKRSGSSLLYLSCALIRANFVTILQYRLRSFNIQGDRGTRGLLAKPVQCSNQLS